VRRGVFVVAVAVTCANGVAAGVAASQTSEAQPHAPFRPMQGTTEALNPAQLQQNQRLLQEMHSMAAHDRPKWGQRTQTSGQSPIFRNAPRSGRICQGGYLPFDLRVNHSVFYPPARAAARHCPGGIGQGQSDACDHA
jgi:hypothetical protein